MDIVFTLFVVALVVFAALAICFRGQHKMIAAGIALVVTAAIGALTLLHAEDRQMGPSSNITHSRPMG